MKKAFYYVFAGLLTFGMITSCEESLPKEEIEQPGNEEDGEGGSTAGNDFSEVIDNQFAGNYKGTLSVKIDELQMPEIAQKISISKADTNAINLTISNFSFSGMSLGDIKLEKCVLEIQEDSTYTCEREEEMALPAPIGTCTVKSATSIKGGSVTVKLDIVVPALGNQVVNVVYQGTKLSGQESSEAKITKFVFDTNEPKNAIVTSQPVLDEATKTYTFAVNSDDLESNPNALKELKPTIEVSEKAKYEVSGNDYSTDVTITVTAEDLTVVTYTVKSPVKNSIMKFTFDEWNEVTSNTLKWPTPLPTDKLATANEGVAYLIAFDFFGSLNLSYSTTEETKGYKGSAAKLITQYTKGGGFGMAPAITPGSLFTGKFEFSAVTDQNEQLKLTKFGIPYDKKPINFKGVYKYKSGTNFIDGSNKNDIKENTGDKDACGIYALLYEAKDENGQEVILDGTTIPDSPYRVALAELENGIDTEEWIEFNIPFKYLKPYDTNKIYKLAIVCSSSKKGDQFKGAVGSTLWVDELEVIGE